MTDTPQTPVEQNPSQQQVPAPSGSAPDGFIEIARYNGLVRKVEELTLSNRSLNEQLASKSSEIEQLKGQLSIKDTEKTVAVGERDKSLQEAITEKTKLEAELTELRGLKLKLEVANELKRPDLLKLAERIPSLTDKEALKAIMQDFASFADEAVKSREQQLLAGVMPVASGSSGGAPSMPTTERGWDDYIDKFDLGTPERMKAMDDYGDWLQSKHSK